MAESEVMTSCTAVSARCEVLLLERSLLRDACRLGVQEFLARMSCWVCPRIGHRPSGAPS